MRDRNVFSAPVVNGLYVINTMSEEEVDPQRRLSEEDKRNICNNADLEAIKREYYEKGKMEAAVETMQKGEDIRRMAYDEGYANGRNELSEELMPKYLAMKAIFDKWNDEKTTLLNVLELDAVELVLAIERKIIGYEIQKSKESLGYLIKEAMKTLHDRKIIRIRVSSEDEKYFREGARGFSKTFGEDVEVVVAPHISQGGFIIETDMGNIDAQLRTRWDMLVDAFLSDTKRGRNYINDAPEDLLPETG